MCGVTEKLIEQWFDEKLEVLNETLDVCRQQSAFGNVFLMLSDSDIEALKSGKVLHWAGETFKCGIFVRYEGVKKNSATHRRKQSRKSTGCWRADVRSIERLEMR